MSAQRGMFIVASVLLLVARASSAYVCTPGGGGATNVAPTGVASASSNPATAGNAIDGSPSTSWSAAPGTTSAVFTWEAPADVLVGQVAFPSTTTGFPFTYGNVFVELLDASDVVLASGNAGLVTTTIGSVVNAARVFDARNRTLRKIRLTIGSTGSPGILSMNEIHIFSPLPALPPPLPGPGPEELTPATTFRGVGDADGGAFLSRTNGVSPDGRLVVGETETYSGMLSAFRFADGTLTTLGGGASLLSFSVQQQSFTCATSGPSRAFAASNTGLVVGNTCVGTICGVTRFGGGAPEVYEPNVTGIVFSIGNYASDITADGGEIAGMYQTQAPSLPQWGQENLVRLIVPQYTLLAGYSLSGGLVTQPRLSPDGGCLVATVNPGGGSPSQTASFGACGVRPTETATDVSAGGTHVVGSIGGLAARGSELLGDLAGGAASSRALGVSDDGDTVVGWGSTAAGQEAFVWTPEDGIQRLADVLTSRGIHLTGWTLRQATGVSASGRTIVGWGTNPSGQTEGFLATLGGPAAPPVPALRGHGLALLVAALLLTAAIRLKR